MKNVADHLLQSLQWFAETWSRLSIRSDRAPLDTVDRLFQFVSTRSALIAQKKLYGYLKERTGLRYTSVMEDEVFAHSVDIAKMEVFAACLSDMTVFAVAHLGAQAAIPGEERRAIALACYTNGIRDNEDQAHDKASIDRWIGGFRERAQDVHWDNIAAGTSPFTASPKALVLWAPIADELKRYDREIVENSIRFAWNEVTQDFRKRADPQAIIRDWESAKPTA